MCIVAGHLVHHLSLCRPAPSLLRDIYPFILDHGPREAPFSSALPNELRVIRGLIPIIGGDLGRNSCLTAFCSDSSTHGYALHETCCQVSEMLNVTAWRERWRFFVDHPALTRRVEGGLQGLLADVPDMAPRFEAWFEKEMHDLDCLRPDPGPPPRCPADVRAPPRVRQEVVGLVPQLPARTGCDRSGGAALSRARGAAPKPSTTRRPGLRCWAFDARLSSPGISACRCSRWR